MIDPFLPRLTAAAEESWQTAQYFWDNSQRPGSENCVIQRTLSGQAFWTDGQTDLRVPVGTAMLYSHNECSSYGYPPDQTEPYRLQFIAFNPGCLRPLFEGLRQRFGSILRLPATSEAAHLIENILQLHNDRAFQDLMEFTELINQLLCALWRAQIGAYHDRDPIEYGHYLIHNDPHGKIRIKELADKLGITREHFIREYTTRYGNSPGKTHRELRLNRVQAMLAASNLPVEDVAVACGFGSSDALRRAYRAHFGETPTHTRNHQKHTAP